MRRQSVAATGLWIDIQHLSVARSKAPSPLPSAGALKRTYTSIHAVGSFGKDNVTSVVAGNNGARSRNAVSAVIFAR